MVSHSSRSVLEDAIARKIAEGLSDTQRGVVLSSAQYLRILAGAGAGKTETITRRVLFLLQGVQPSAIVGFTFTERAAAQMKERIYLRTEAILGSQASTNLGDLYVGTIHAFAMSLLQEYFGYGNYSVLDDNQEMAFILREGWGLGLGPGGRLAPTWNYAENCRVFLSSANVVYDELIDRERLAGTDPEFADKLGRYEALLEQHCLLTFGRMIYLVVRHLEREPQVLARYQHLIVDEYQDINKAQETFIDLICQHASCYVVGDPRQCIYEWRGSDPGCFGRFADRYQAHTVEIRQNRRSTTSIVAAGNVVARHLNDELLRRSMERVRPETGRVALFEHKTPPEEAAWLASQVQALVAGNVCRYQDIAILLRSVNTSAGPILEALRARQIPYLVAGKVGLFRRDEAQALGALFNWCAQMDWPTDAWGREAIPGQRIPEFVSWMWPARVPARGLEEFRRELLAGRYQHFTDAYQDLLVRLGVPGWDPDDSQDAVRLANLGRFNTLLGDYETARRLGGDWGNWEQDVRGLAWFIRSHALTAYEEQAAEDLRGVDAVQLMTVHQAKGLEWPVVFVPALADRRFPSIMTGRVRQWLLSTSLFDADRYHGSVDAERKLFYVAVTRARDGLALSYFRRISNRATRSRFVNELDLGVSAPPTGPFIERVGQLLASDEEVLTFSATEIIEYLRCPHFYRLRNLWGYQGGVVPELGYGKAIHHILHLMADEARRGGDHQQVLDRLVDEHFHLPYAPRGESAALRDAARRMLQRYMAQHRSEFAHVGEVEARIEFQLGRMGATWRRLRVAWT